jgi:hypothetical protein
MPQAVRKWNYLIITASNKQQAVAYKEQLDLRRGLGFLSDTKKVVVVADPKGICVLLNDGTVKFICTEEELAQLLWK